MSRKINAAISAGAVFIGALSVATTAYSANTGRQSLGYSRESLDVWVAECPSEANSIKVSVADLLSPNNPKAKLRVIVVKDGHSALAEDRNSVAAYISGEGGAYSDPVTLMQGPGTYILNYFKTETGTENYRSIVSCVSPEGKAIEPTNLVLADDDLAP